MNRFYFYLLAAFSLFPFVNAHSQFVENKGQVIDVDENLRPEVKFTYGIGHTGLFFLDNKVVYSFLDVDYVDESLYANNQNELDSVKALRGFTSHRMDMEFVGANSNIEIVKGDKVDGVKHYYLNKRNGIRDVESFSSITYKNMYDNIDVVFYQMASGMKYDFVLKEGANIKDIKINYNGAKALTIENGKLYIETTFETLSEEIPLSFIDGDKNNEVEVSYFIDENGYLCFKTKSTDYQSLTIDPVLEWATYYNNSATGSDALDYSRSHLDASGNLFIYGQVYSAGGNYPVISPGGSAYTQSYNSSSEVYIAKFNSSRTLVWSTYLGGSGSDNSYGSSNLDTRGNVLHVVGERISTGAPFTNGGGYYDATANKAFWARFNITTGALTHLTAVGGGYAPSVAVSSAGQVAIIMDAYTTSSPPIMTRAGAYNQATSGGSTDMFLMLMNSSYAQIWGTFLGGPAPQQNFMCKFDNNNNIVFVGETSWFTASTIATEHLVNLSGAYNSTTAGGGVDVLLGKFNTSGALVWNTLYGGDNSDARRDQQGGYAKINFHPTTNELVLVFNTTSTNLPTVNQGGGAYFKTVPTHSGFGGSFGSYTDYAAYMVKFNTSLARNHATYWYSSTGGDLIFDATFGGCNKFYIAGKSDMATVTTITQTGGFNLAAGQQTFIMQFDNTDFSAEWSSFLAANTSYNPSAAGRSDNPRVYFSARGYNDNGPTVDPGGSAYYEANNINGTGQNFMIWQLHPTIPPNISGTTTLCSGQTTTLTASGGAGAPYNWYTAASGGTAFNTGATYTTPALSSSVTYYVSSGSGLCISPRKAVTITVNPGPSAPTISSNSPVCLGGTLNLTSNTVSGATYAWTGPSSYTSSAEDPTRTSVTAAMAGTYNCTVTIAGCTSAAASTAVVVNTPSVAPTGITGTSIICNGVSTTLTLAGGTSGTGATAQWFTGSCGGTAAGTGNSITVSPSSSTTYFVRYNGTCNTTTCASQLVTVNAIPTAPTISSNTPVCEGTSINLTSNTISGATYAWTGPASFTSSSEDPSIASAAAAMAGTYNCTVTVSGCASSTSSTTVAVTAAPSVTAANSGNVCVGNSINLTPATGGNWSSNATGVATVTNGGVVSGVSGGSANMTFTSTATGCSSIGSGGNITVNALPTVTVPGSGEVCVNGNITLSPTTGGTWSSSATGIATITSAGVVTGVSAGNADMTFTNTTTGCASTAASGSVTVNPLEDASFTYPASTYCITSPSDPIATVTGVTGGTFSINNGGTIASITGEIDLDANGVQNYTVTYTTGGTCAGVETAIVNVTSGPLANFSYTSSPYCGGTGTADVTYGAGGSAGVFAPIPATTALVINTTTGAVDLNASAPGTYTVENDIVASGGCAASYATSDITITAQEDASYSYGASNTFCESATNPTATITGTPGGVFTATPTGITVDGTTGEIDLSASTFGATYTVRYITPGTCSDTLTIDVTLESSPTVPSAGTTAGSNTICVGESANITASGSTGTGVITYAVFDAMTAGTNLGATPLTVSPTTTTTYYVESFNTNGCGNVGGRQAVTVTVNALPTIDAGSDETICPTDNVTLTATGTGTLVWSTTETTSSITVTPTVTTTYSVTLTDANTCVNTDDVIVTVVTNGGTLVAEDDTFTVETDTPINMDVLLNDIYGGNTSNIILVPSNGVATADINGNIDYQSDAGFIGVDSLTYEICDVTCATICDTAVVVITVEKTIDFSVPGGFSPNGDNINDIFVIQGLEEYPNNNLSIFNRWGSIILQASPYNNDWDGSATEGVVLSGDKVTSGTYFYILELGEGIEPLRGSIEIKRD